jgi:choline-sulfatase
VPAGAVWFLSDEHNAAISSPYGHRRVRTPNMARLAAAGTVYESCYTPSPLCLPARSALMSGRRVHEIQTYSNCNLDLTCPDPVSYAAVLGAAGVHTAYVGKTDVYAPPEDLGFTEMILGGARKAPGDSNHRRNPMAVRPGGAARGDGFGSRPDPFRSDLARVDAAVDWLRTTAPGLEDPWLLVINTSKPHFAHTVTPALWEEYADAADLPAHGADSESGRHPHAVGLRRHFETDGFTEAQVRGLRRGYYGCVSFVDAQLGRILDTIEETHLRDTAVVYGSDHGEMLGEFGLWWKCSLHEASTRVPCIAAGPGFGAGARVRTPMDLHDVRAGLMAHLGVDQPAGWTGIPVQDLAGDDPGRVAFSEYHGHGATASAYMVRRRRWKLIHYIDAPDQLFDLRSDPEELVNRAGDEPSLVDELHRELTAICDPAVENERAESFISSQLARLPAGAS